MMTGTLYIVGTPIGNPGDISQRAIETLRKVEAVACEERKEGERLLRTLRIEKPLVQINEHTEKQNTEGILLDLASGKSYALISDCGMPVFADPGTFLIGEAMEMKLPVVVIPGPTSLTTALAISGFDVSRFFFYGFLSPKRAERKAELQQLRAVEVPLVFLDAPYRLLQVLEEMSAVFGKSRRACVACDLTLQRELVRRDSLGRLCDYFSAHPDKREFVIIVGAERRRKK